jgi:hypothetical protein
MIVQIQGAVSHIHVTVAEAHELISALTAACPRGDASTASGAIAVHVHSDPAPPGARHEAVEER